MIRVDELLIEVLVCRLSLGEYARGKGGNGLDIYQEFSARHLMPCLDSEAFLDYLLRQWTLRGRHLDVCQVVDHPKFDEIIGAFEQEERFSVFVELSQVYKGEIPLANTYNDTLLDIVYGEDFDPLDMESIIRVKGDWKYHLWFYYLNNEGYIHEAWELFDAKIYPLCMSLSSTRPEHVQAVVRYFDELCILMQKTRNPEVLYGVDENTVRNLHELFLLNLRNNTVIETSNKQDFCANVVYFMAHKNMHHLGVEFYTTFKEFFDLNDMSTVMKLVGLSEHANDYYAVRVIYGDIQALQYRIDKYKNDIDRHLVGVAEYILRVKRLIEENHGDMLRGNSFIKESFDFFFDECWIDESIATDFSTLSFIEKDHMLRKLLDASVCFFREHKQITSAAGNTMEPALSVLIDFEVGMEGMRLYNRIVSLSPAQGIDYKEMVIGESLTQLHDFLTQFYLKEQLEHAAVVLETSDQTTHKIKDEKMALQSLGKIYAELRPQDFSVQPTTSYGFTQQEQRRFVEENSRFDSLMAFDEVKKLLLTAESQRSVHSLGVNSQRYTYIAATYLKAVEVFLREKLVALQDERANLPKIEMYKNDQPCDRIVGSEDYYAGVTIGNIYRYIVDYGTTILKPVADKKKVKAYLKHWASTIRDASFHKDRVLSVEDLESLRIDTLIVLKRLLSDFE